MAVALSLLAVQGARGEPPSETPTGSFLSSLKQAINKDFDHEVVRGHFDVGTAPDSHRYYCLADSRTGKTETNGVAGHPYLRTDGMTGLKDGAVSFYSCASAEQRGVLMSSGYLLSGGAAAAGANPAAATATAAATPSMPVPRSEALETIDVAGLRLGMSPDQVRTILKSKRLLDYHESAQYLSEDPAARSQLAAAGRFINTIESWSRANAGGESYEVMFTPVPGAERAMSIVHSVSYTAENAVREVTFVNGLLKKYGGYDPSSGLPESPTWRVQSGGQVMIGDSCNRRTVVGGLRELEARIEPRQNLALRTTPEEFQYQIDHCGVAILTEDHTFDKGRASIEERTLRRFNMTAYSPLIGLDGATAAMQLMHTARNAMPGAKVPQTEYPPEPTL